jgi:response regulator of citrate/malate metabolism
MAMIGKVRRMHFRQSKTVREIARATSLSRNTVRKYLRVEPYFPQVGRRICA